MGRYGSVTAVQNIGEVEKRCLSTPNQRSQNLSHVCGLALNQEIRIFFPSNSNDTWLSFTYCWLVCDVSDRKRGSDSGEVG